ncbi:hypothetical protein X802_09890 [Thermococcus guaymasensis DSM 11113]|uniref:Nitroreductase domain-containing protein n=1 Tax=Thermococcus guaymasensis DSM 11113 TaxID=1432656 RepID=A0A0X1KNM2_9EURY|nr:hypothetical protein X802_09890 [Thermococcus guaymasensis DSM 11113]
MRNAEEMYQTPFSNALGSGMEFFEVLGKRRSIRRFQNKPVPRELVEKLFEAAFLSRVRSTRGLGTSSWLTTEESSLLSQRQS